MLKRFTVVLILVADCCAAAAIMACSASGRTPAGPAPRPGQPLSPGGIEVGAPDDGLFADQPPGGGFPPFLKFHVE